jgi:hypothetical protein
VIVGEEIQDADGDLSRSSSTRRSRPGLPADEAIAARRAQGGLDLGSPPVRPLPGSLLRDARWSASSTQVDWVEAHNARIAVGKGNQQAAELAVGDGKPGIAGVRRAQLVRGRRGLPRSSTATRRPRTACARRSPPPS